MNNLFSHFNGLDSGYIRYLSSRHNLFFENLKMEGLNQYSIFVTAMFVCSSKPFFFCLTICCSDLAKANSILSSVTSYAVAMSQSICYFVAVAFSPIL